jgi:hypothetical protein
MSAEAVAWAKKLEGLSSSQKNVLRALADYCNHEHACFPSVPTLARDTALAVRTVQRALAELEALGALSRRLRRASPTGGRQTSNMIFLSVGLALGEAKIEPSKAIEGCHSVTPRVSQCHPTGVTVSPLLTTNLTSLEKNAGEKILKPSRSSVRPEGRSPGSHRGGHGKAKACELVQELDVPVDKQAFEAWGALVAAIVAKREHEAARAWLSRASGAAVERAGVISVANGFKQERLKQALGSLLDEVGWQVIVRGSV